MNAQFRCNFPRMFGTMACIGRRIHCPVNPPPSRSVWLVRGLKWRVHVIYLAATQVARAKGHKEGARGRGSFCGLCRSVQSSDAVFAAII